MYEKHTDGGQSCTFTNLLRVLNVKHMRTHNKGFLRDLLSSPGPQQNYKQPELPSSRDRTPHVRAPVMSCYLQQQIRWTEEHEKKWCRSSPEAYARFPRARRDSRASVRWRRTDALIGETHRSMKQVKRSTASQWITARAIPANTHRRSISDKYETAASLIFINSMIVCEWTDEGFGV